MEQKGMIGQDVFYRVKLAGGGSYVNETRAWDVNALRANMAKSYAEAKDGPHIVEFITKEEYQKCKVVKKK